MTRKGSEVRVLYGPREVAGQRVARDFDWRAEAHCAPSAVRTENGAIDGADALKWLGTVAAGIGVAVAIGWVSIVKTQPAK